ncbi:MAG TPA: hypothetical protein VH593_01850 [Ktedonobacteraceae bacterium]|jgi:hypothetical protein
MSHRRRTLKLRDRVFRHDDPRHIGIVINLFKWKRYDEWMANVVWLDTNWHEYVPMAMLAHAED